MFSMTRFMPFAAIVLAGLLAGCSSKYATPGKGADMALFGVDAQSQRLLTDGRIQDVLDRQPLARFPVNLAVVRVQGPGYSSYTVRGFGHGRYTVVTTRDIETDEDLDRLRRMPMVSDIAVLNRLLLPAHLESDRDLRQAAASLHADVVLIYTIDTAFFDTHRPQPLNLVAFGFVPDKDIEIRTTASAALLDTRNGYVYGIAEGTHIERHAVSIWTNDEIADKSRRDTEREAFEKMLKETERVWTQVVAHQINRQAMRSTSPPRISDEYIPRGPRYATEKRD